MSWGGGVVGYFWVFYSVVFPCSRLEKLRVGEAVRESFLDFTLDLVLGADSFLELFLLDYQPSGEIIDTIGQVIVDILLGLGSRQ